MSRHVDNFVRLKWLVKNIEKEVSGLKVTRDFCAPTNDANDSSY
jgi:hypothetical protein